MQTCVMKDHSIAVSPRSQVSRSSGGTLSGTDGRGSGEEGSKRRRISSAKQAAESSSSGDENLSALPCLVTLNPGVRIATVAAGGRHTLALSGKSFKRKKTLLSTSLHSDHRSEADQAPQTYEAFESLFR